MTQHNGTQYCYAECLCCVIYTESLNQAHYAERHYTECRYDECRGAYPQHLRIRLMWNRLTVKNTLTYCAVEKNYGSKKFYGTAPFIEQHMFQYIYCSS